MMRKTPLWKTLHTKGGELRGGWDYARNGELDVNPNRARQTKQNPFHSGVLLYDGDVKGVGGLVKTDY